MIWGLGVGYVISGMYFGWNLGLAEGGTYGMLLATGFVAVLYFTFTFSYAELACAIPKAGGAFDYAKVALGKRWAFVAGMAQFVEFVFAPPAIAMGIGAYLNTLFPGIPVLVFSVLAYLFFTAVNIYGVKAAAIFELTVTVIAIVGLCLFFYWTIGSFDQQAFAKDAWNQDVKGVFAAVPFAIWFFLGIEGLANVAEETVDTKRTILKGFSYAIITLILLCFMTFLGSVGLHGWKAVVYDGTAISDSPLPLALRSLFGANSIQVNIIVVIGTFGLVASFHGLILAAGRATYEMGKAGFAPAFLGKIYVKTSTPLSALLFNMLTGILIILTGKTADIIIIAVFGALSLYMISMISLFAYRKKEPDAERPFLTPFYPFTPGIALLFSGICMIAMLFYFWKNGLIYFGFMIFSLAVYLIVQHIYRSRIQNIKN